MGQRTSTRHTGHTRLQRYVFAPASVIQPLLRKYLSRKPLDLPPEVARRFMEDLRAFFAEKNTVKRDEIAIRQLVALNEHLGRRQKPLRVSDVKEMFLQMKDRT